MRVRALAAGAWDGLRPEHPMLIGVLGLFAAFWVVSLHFKFSPIVFPVGKARLWDVAVEANMWTWANVAVLISAANAHALRAFSLWRGRGGAWLGWAVTATIMLALSLDDLVGFHERLQQLGARMGGGEGYLHFAWVVPGAILALSCIAIVGTHAVRLAPAPRAYLLAGVGMLFAGAVGLEMVSGADLSEKGHTLSYVAIYHVEELFEAIGAALLLAAPLSDLPRGALRRASP